MIAHPSAAMLEAYVTHAPCDREAIEAHAAGCPACVEAIAALGRALVPGSADDEAFLRELIATPAREKVARVIPLRRGLAALAVAAAAALVLAVPGEDPAEVLAEAFASGRPLEPRSSLPVPWARYEPVRGPDDRATALDRAVGDLLPARESQEAARALAAVYAARRDPGDLREATAALAHSPEGPERLSDEAMVLLASGQADAALEKLDRALAQRPDLLPALFNRALALGALQREGDAIISWRRYLEAAGDRDPGWIDEARERLADLERRAAARGE